MLLSSHATCSRVVAHTKKIAERTRRIGCSITRGRSSHAHQHTLFVCVRRAAYVVRFVTHTTRTLSVGGLKNTFSGNRLFWSTRSSVLCSAFYHRPLFARHQTQHTSRRFSRNFTPLVCHCDDFHTHSLHFFSLSRSCFSLSLSH